MTTAIENGRVPQITLRHRLRIAREEAGLEQQQLAEMMGVSRNTVNNAEKGKTRPRRLLINAWALATGFDVNWLEHGLPPTPGPDDQCPHQGSNLGPTDYKSGSQAFSVRHLHAA